MSTEKNKAERIVGKLQGFWAAFVSFFGFMKRGPLGFIGRSISAIWGWYVRVIWNRFAKNDEGRLTTKRAGTTFVATLFTLWMLPTVFLFFFQVFLMMTTMKHEQVYLTQSEEIGVSEELFNVRGNTKPVSTPENALYYRVRPTIAHQIYSYWNYSTPFYAEDIASVAPGLNKCDVVSYGFRMRLLVRGWGIYPDMLWSSCEPVNVSGPAPTAPAEG
ncbi:MAG: hypothetical protein ABJN42_03640 [Roseibium sp.]|uniref:hypothetical protein n=1 Tax=Roseibium sp. TaxID=1936156 RepID=UPI003296E164